MADAAAGSVDKSVQVKLVLLGMSLHLTLRSYTPPASSFPHITRRGCRWQVIRRSSIRESLSQALITCLHTPSPRST